jgi:hypothetical protein
MDLIIKRDIVFHGQKLKQGQKYTPKNKAESRYLVAYKLATVNTEPEIKVNTEPLTESTEPKKETKPKKEK